MNTLPDWLSGATLEPAKVDNTHSTITATTSPPATSPQLAFEANPKYPITHSERELHTMQRTAMLEIILERLEEGAVWRDIMSDMPATYDHLKPGMMAWIKRNPEHFKRYKESQSIGGEIILATNISISDGDGLEDVQRSKLRIDTRKDYLEKIDPVRFGKVQNAAPSFGQGGINININAVESPYAKPMLANVVEVTPLVEMVEDAQVREIEVSK